MNDVALRANDVLRNDVMLRINDVALRATGMKPFVKSLFATAKSVFYDTHAAKRFVNLFCQKRDISPLGIGCSGVSVYRRWAAISSLCSIFPVQI